MPEAADPQLCVPTIHIIDDDSDLRSSLLGFFESRGMRAATFESAGQFLECADLSQPGCILLDIRMPGMTGLELQAKLARLGYPLPIIFMTGNASVASSVSAMKAGALDYLVKPFRPESLIQATTQALERNAKLRARDAASLQMRARVDKLTPREAEVFGYVSKGLMNKQIAHEMKISEIMVKLHRGRMMKKLEARSIADVVRIFDEANRHAS
ncbi:response regulator transcription factor [Mycoplana rhizolycopersici]|uniref:Response regulator transcription factor n=1 Tax=Mycoplana rhizolycopersici TaxID=2746702 RepID=A0ABX2QP18_9HYPH|nr:response regulator [Rhizobium rhizolycopersici]NVP58293.1 response regulator transcription factor [Rhizobium rhizolycopersici]